MFRFTLSIGKVSSPSPVSEFQLTGYAQYPCVDQQIQGRVQ